LSLALLVLLVGCSSCKLSLVLGTLLANLPCIASGNPKCFPHCTFFDGSFSFVGWALLFPFQLPYVASGKPKFFPTAPLSLALSVLLVGHSSCQLGLVLGAPLANLPCIASRNSNFFPTIPLLLALSVLLVGHSSFQVGLVLGVPVCTQFVTW
jgi:hypothetical protein